MNNKLTILYVILSFCDLATTLHLIKLCNLNIEGNFLASLIYDLHGCNGMAVFKTLSTTLVVIIAAYVSFKGYSFHSNLILLIGCFTYSLVLIYTLTLILAFYG